MTPVLDSSALLALLLDEPGWPLVSEMLRSAIISSVNFSEIVSRLQDRGFSDSQIDLVLRPLPLAVVAFSKEQAVAAGQLRRSTRSAGLSLGDRACLALALETGGVAITADRAWTGLDIGVDVRLIR